VTGPCSGCLRLFIVVEPTTEQFQGFSEPVNDRKRWLDQFVHLMGHTGNYTREEAIAAIDKDRILPDMLCFNPSKPAEYPNGRVFSDDVIDHRLAFLSKGEIPPDGLKPHTAENPAPQACRIAVWGEWQWHNTWSSTSLRSSDRIELMVVCH
jgi:hypothetical protein